MKNLAWREIAYKHYALVLTDTNEIVKEVTGSYPLGVYAYGRRKFLSLEAAQECAQKDYEKSIRGDA